jgi:hypothetical protein
MASSLSAPTSQALFRCRAWTWENYIVEGGAVALGHHFLTLALPQGQDLNTRVIDDIEVSVFRPRVTRVRHPCC